MSEWIDATSLGIPRLRANPHAPLQLMHIGIDVGTQAQLRDDGVIWTVVKLEPYPHGDIPIWKSPKMTKIGAPWWPGEPPPHGWKIRNLHA